MSSLGTEDIKKSKARRVISLLMAYLLVSTTFLHMHASGDPSTSATEWKAGVARMVITPDEPMWMAGYSARDRPSEGTLHDLWAKALVLEDASGQQVVLVTADLRNFSKEISDGIRDQIETQFGLTRAEVILNGSHTHSGPLLNTERNQPAYLSALEAEQRKKVEQYSEKLEDQIVALVGEALQSTEPARLYAGNGVTRFAVNRRNNLDETLHQQSELKGPSDYAVPVIKVEDETGDLIAVAFGYACHPTVLNGYEWSGDYAGFAQLELEKRYPDTTALFFQGAGADQNPLPRRSVALAEQYGRTLTAAVERVLKDEMKSLPGELSAAYSEVELSLTTPPTREELEEVAEESSASSRRWASYMIDKLERGEALRTSYLYPVQVWQLGGQPVISLGGELVVDYAITLKRIFGQDTFVLGYSNDVMGYIPSARIIEEGGYEGASSQRVRALPSTWSADIEVAILDEVVKVAEQAGVPPREP